MAELVAYLLPILAVDVLNPVLFAFLVFAAGSSRPVLNSSLLLLGHTTAYFLAGIAASFGFDAVYEFLANPTPVMFGVSLLLGLLLLWVALRAKKEGAPEADEPEGDLTPATCFGFGAVINFIGIPFALPYFAAVDQILKADLSVAGSLTVLAGYNLAYAAVFTVVPIAVAISGDRARPLLEKINGILVKASDLVMPWVLGGLGLFLVVDAVKFFATGSGLT